MDGDTNPRVRRTAPKEVRRQQLIDATIAAIAELGVSRATMAEITGRAGLSMGIVNLHFENKDNLLKSTLLHLADELRGNWLRFQEDESLGPAEKLWGIVGANFDESIATREKVRAWFAFFGEARYRAFYREMVSNFDDERTTVVEDLLWQLREESGSRVGFDPAGLSLSIEAIADGLWLSIMLYPDAVTLSKSRRRLWELLSTYFPDHYPLNAEASMSAIQ
ncbi:MAG: TetR/AcrR family transcriptional regulator [Pseudomonadota bacterium]